MTKKFFPFIHLIFSLIFFCTLSAPLLIELFFPSFTVSLGGVVQEKKVPPLSTKNILSGKFQSRFEKWFLRELGVRPLLVKTDNQLDFSLFSQISSSNHGKAILGNEGHLIERTYLKRGQGALAPHKKKLRAKIKELKELQSFLQSRNIQLLILISPNKPSLYPETIPPLHRIPPSLRSKYVPLNFFSKLLEEEKIPFIASKPYLERKKNFFDYPFFAPTGTHWSELGSCLVAEEMFRQISILIPSFSGGLTCHATGERKTPLPIDRDLLSVANIWTPKVLLQPAPKVERVMVQTEHAPSVLFVGTSFLWSLFYNVDKTKLFHERDMYYYFKRSVPHEGKEAVIDRSDPRWVKLALKRDLIVLEVNEAFLHRIGYNFPKQVLEQNR